MAAITPHAWSKIRQRLQDLITENIELASPGNQDAQITVFEDPTVQKFLRPLISKQGEEMAFEMFCNYFDNTINAFIETGIIAEDELVPVNSGMAG